MKFKNQGAELYIPDGKAQAEAFASAYGGALAIGAHQDDLEIFAMHGIGQSFSRSSKRFVGVTVTNGGGSARKGPFVNLTDAQMVDERHKEQNEAARLGNYAAQFQLRYPSSSIKGISPPLGQELVQELLAILRLTKPETLYIHNPFDKHESHLACMRASLEAVRIYAGEMDPQFPLRTIFGCEVWRGLDWLPDSYKVLLDVSDYLDLQRELIGAHRSQIEGSKNYIDATLGRQFANATYNDSHNLDEAVAATLALDLSEFLTDPDLTLVNFQTRILDEYNRLILEKAAQYDI
jgi:LmbE family N-acetylglucosaminyl deacetylase